MNTWVVLSGKGGTGKTSLVAAFATLTRNAVLADADVDAANLHLGLGARSTLRAPFHAGARARIDPDHCTACNACAEVCRYGAVRAGASYHIDRLTCEGCNACVIVCPAQAITLEPNCAGELLESETDQGLLIHAELGVAQDNSGKLVAAVLERAKQRAAERNLDLILVDGPPGIGCPVHAAITGAERMLAVTEPSAAGKHDLIRLLDLAQHFQVPAAIAINRWDLSPSVTSQITDDAKSRGVAVLGRIPFDRQLPLGLCLGQAPLAAASPETARAIVALWNRWSTALPGDSDADS